MKFRLAALAAITLLTSTVSFAGMVNTSSNLEFLIVDGQKTTKNLLKETRSLNLSANQTHQVVVRLSEIVREGSERTLFESNPIIITFQGSAEDLTISAPRLENKREAELFQANPEISVKTVSGKTISFKQDYLKQEGFLPNLNIEQNVAQYNASGAPAAVSSFAMITMPAMATTAPTVTGLTKANKAKVTIQGENIQEQQLQYWFQQADKETQARFLDWAKKHK